jgi:serine/threonine-protein kinase
VQTDPPPLWQALESGVTELEIILARGGQGVGVVGIVLAVWVATFVSRETGAVLAVVVAATLSFYTAVHALLRRGIAVRTLRFVAPLFEVAVPAAVLWILGRTEGAAYAVGSWVPPQLFCVFIAASILRLDPRVPLAMGALAAALYGAIWFGDLRAHVDPTMTLYRTEMQLVRMGSLVLTGVACAGAVLSLRAAIAEASSQLRSKELFGKYRLGRDLASGGMGRVVEALYCPEGGFQRRVAIKLVHPHLSQDPHFVDRFRHEAELASLLAHPNIVQALDFGRVGDTWFLVMEYVDGRTLHDVLGERRRGARPLPPRLVAELGRQIADGLDHAHVRAVDETGRPLRVVHRDLSPSNVMIDRSGRVRITDFGVARALRGSDRILTENLVGKPAYVSPEALQGEGVDERSDLWSLAVVLWEALANRRLFQRDHDGAALLAVVEAHIPPLAEVRPEAGPTWQAFFDRALSRDRSARFPTAAELRDALAAVVAAEGPVPPHEVGELVAAEEELDELPLDATSEEVPR